MSTKDVEFDYQSHMKHSSPDRKQIQRGPQARQQRRETAKSRITIQIDAEVVDQFKRLVPSGQGYQSLMNQALREWLVAQGVKELLQVELKDMTNKVVASIKETTTTS